MRVVPRPWRGWFSFACPYGPLEYGNFDRRSDCASEQFEAEKQGEADGQRPVPPRPFPERLAKGAGAGVDLPRKRYQAAGSDRFLRPVRRAAPEQREPDGVQARDL